MQMGSDAVIKNQVTGRVSERLILVDKRQIYMETTVHLVPKIAGSREMTIKISQTHRCSLFRQI